MKVPRLEPVAPRVWLLRGGLTGLMNVYLIEDEGRWSAGERIAGVGHLGPVTGPGVVAELEAAAR